MGCTQAGSGYWIPCCWSLQVFMSYLIPVLGSKLLIEPSAQILPMLYLCNCDLENLTFLSYLLCKLGCIIESDLICDLALVYLKRWHLLSFHCLTELHF